MIDNIRFEEGFLSEIKNFFENNKIEKISILPFEYNDDYKNPIVKFNRIIHVPQDAILRNGLNYVQINPKFLKKSISYCNDNNLNFGIIHNHTNDVNDFSQQDLEVEKILIKNIFKTTNINLIANVLYWNNVVRFRIIDRKFLMDSYSEFFCEVM